ncbi:MAG: YggT family protein [Acidimicrobiia bacterium]
MSFIISLLQLFSLLLIAWIVLSYIVVFGRVTFDHPIAKAYRLLSRMIEPILKPIRAVVPSVRVGGASLDLSPLILIVGVQVLIAVLA